MKVTSSGDRLNILLSCEYTFHHNWMSFASWYSAYKMLPDAKVALLCARNLQGGYAAYDWPYRCDIRFFQHENVGRRFNCPELNRLYAVCVALKEGILKQPLVVIESDVMAVRSLPKDVLQRMNDSEPIFAISGPVWYFNNQPIERFVSALHRFEDLRHKEQTNTQKVMGMISSVMGESDYLLDLCCNCRQSELATFVHYSEGCGKFEKDSWIQHRPFPPFYYTSELLKGVDATANERHIMRMWNQMRQVYDAVR